MDNLEQYFKEHSDVLEKSDDCIPEGDVSRFEKRWEYSSRDRIRFRSSLRRRRKPLWKVVLFPLAASVALIVGVRIIINPFIREEDPLRKESFAVAADTLSPSEVNSLYYDRMMSEMDEIYALAETLENEDPNQIYMTVDVITREAIPLIDQLPDEMSDADKIEVLTEYARRRIDALEKYKSTLLANNI